MVGQEAKRANSWKKFPQSSEENTVNSNGCFQSPHGVFFLPSVAPVLGLSAPVLGLCVRRLHGRAGVHHVRSAWNFPVTGEAPDGGFALVLRLRAHNWQKTEFIRIQNVLHRRTFWISFMLCGEVFLQPFCCSKGAWKVFEATERSLPFFHAKFSEKSITFLETPGVGNTSQRITLTNGLNNSQVYQIEEVGVNFDWSPSSPAWFQGLPDG